MERDTLTWLFHLNDEKQGFRRTLSEGIMARLFHGKNVTISIVTLEPYSEGRFTASKTLKWGVLFSHRGRKELSLMVKPIFSGPKWALRKLSLAST